MNKHADRSLSLSFASARGLARGPGPLGLRPLHGAQAQWAQAHWAWAVYLFCHIWDCFNVWAMHGMPDNAYCFATGAIVNEAHWAGQAPPTSKKKQSLHPWETVESRISKQKPIAETEKDKENEKCSNNNVKIRSMNNEPFLFIKLFINLFIRQNDL